MAMTMIWQIFLNDNVRISIKISLKFVSKGPIDSIRALVQIMAWRRSGDKPLSELIYQFMGRSAWIQWTGVLKVLLRLFIHHIIMSFPKNKT